MTNETILEWETDVAQLGATAERINEQFSDFERLTGHARELATSALYCALGAGQALIEAKDALPHGKFTPWVEQNCRCSLRWAQEAMRVVRHWPDIEQLSKAQDSALLTFDDALKLIDTLQSGHAAPGTPEPNGLPHLPARSACRTSMKQRSGCRGERPAAERVDELLRKHVGPLERGIDAVANVNGGMGDQHAAASNALNALSAALEQMKGGKR